MTELEKKLAELNGTLSLHYKKRIIGLIRERYDANDELAILRQVDTKPQDYADYNAYCEECKAKAKKEIYGDEK